MRARCVTGDPAQRRELDGVRSRRVLIRQNSALRQGVALPGKDSASLRLPSMSDAERALSTCSKHSETALMAPSRIRAGAEGRADLPGEAASHVHQVTTL